MSQAIAERGVEISEAVPLRDFGRKLTPPKAGKTLYWWHWRGRLNRHTKRLVKLECIHVTTGLATSRAAYERFIARLNEKDLAAGG